MTSFADAGGTTTYHYNTLNQVDWMAEPGASTHTTSTYDNMGNRTSIAYPSGVSGNYDYDPATSRITAVTSKASGGSVLKSYSYTHTQGANDSELRQTVTEQPGNTTTTYSYDELDGLREATATGATPSPACG